MALSVRTVNYFYTRIQAEPGKPYELLARLADEDVNLLAFSAIPYGPNHPSSDILDLLARLWKARCGSCRTRF
jgi:hypothetical protein